MGRPHANDWTLPHFSGWAVLWRYSEIPEADVRYGSMSLIKYRMRGVWVSIGFFDPSILPIGRVFLTSVRRLMGLPLTWRLLPARREAAARVGWRAS